MTVSVRLAHDVTADFRSVVDAAQFLRMLGVASEAKTPAAIPAVTASPSMDGPADSTPVDAPMPLAGLATSLMLAEVQAAASIDTVAGCRAA